jgi:hypothetical protein
VRAVVVIVFLMGIAHAAPPEPSGAHPRMLLDATVRTAWQQAAKENKGPVATAIALCDEARTSPDYEHALYQGANWQKALQGCLVAWAATEKPEHAKTAIRFFNALLDDLDKIGDRQGGDAAATRDRGYAIRNLGPYTALAYDWLYAQLTPELRTKARKRWAAWLDWYKDNGYHPHDPGSNYQAGYLLAATMIAVAQGGEAGDAGKAHWRLVADQLWTKDMGAALAPGGVLEGGDWPEGWQYAPLAVVSYALAARVARGAGIEVKGIDTWLESVLHRYVYALTPTERVYPGGDADIDTAYLDINVNTLSAIALGDAAPEVKQFARGELSRLKLTDTEALVPSSLAYVGDKPKLIPRGSWPSWYLAKGTGTLFARTRWDDKAVWFVAECTNTTNNDHHAPNAGTFVLTRGKDDVIVDPSPYGSLSTLTGNAPTVRSPQLPKNYQPSQASWGEDSGWRWTAQTRSGIVAARCDYAGQFKFQDRKSDIAEALRDFVVLPNSEGTDAVLLVVDRAKTPGTEMYVQFRVPVAFTLADDTASATIGATRLAITSVDRSGGAPTKSAPSAKDCFVEGTKRGSCDAARMPVTDFRITIPGPAPRAVNAIAASGGKLAPRVTKLGDKTWSGARVTGLRDAVVVWPTEPHQPFSYRVPRGAAVAHVVLDAPESKSGKATITATLDGDSCNVSVQAGDDVRARPAIVVLDDACKVAADPDAAAPSKPFSTGAAPEPIRKQETPAKRSGCCAAQSTPRPPIILSILVALILIRRRRRT